MTTLCSLRTWQRCWGLAKGSTPATRLGKRPSFTLVEMLVAMAITLIMMAAVVTLFANVSNSVRNRRATMEMNGQIRSVRNVLQQDLQGATCPGVTWQKPDSNHGYIELIEGPYHEGYATNLIDANPNSSPKQNWPPTALNPELDHAASTIPTSNVPLADASWASDGSGLGDYDDILMLTVRNEHKPFVGRTPSEVDANGGFKNWKSVNTESTLAEVIWFAMENPGYADQALTDPDPTGKRFFGEPGYRTIYRRTLLIAPWLNPYSLTKVIRADGTVTIDNATVKAVPGLLRVLPRNITVESAIAGLIAFQDRYDISARIEWDYSLDPGNGRWKIVANTLADLTKRENRFGHFGYRAQPASGQPSREFPFAVTSVGSGFSGGSVALRLVTDPDLNLSPKTPAKPVGNVDPGSKAIVSYTVPAGQAGSDYQVRPFVVVDDKCTAIATAQAMLNDDGEVVRVVHGPVPLWGTRRGEDVMLTDVLAFDLRVFDPGAPIFRHLPTETVLTPSDPGWKTAYLSNDNMKQDGSGAIGAANSANGVIYPYVGQGAYVDLGYGFGLPINADPFAAAFKSSTLPWFFTARALSDVFNNQLATGFSVYDTWSFHYENDGLNEDGDLYLNPATNKWEPLIDEGTNGLDDRIPNGGGDPLKTGDDPNDVAVLGVDDVGERETVPPYDKPLRGVQVILRAYERDSRSIRQVRVNQHFMQE